MYAFFFFGGLLRAFLKEEEPIVIKVRGLGELGANIISEWTERLVELGSRWMTGLVRGKEPKRAQLGKRGGWE